MPQSKEFLQEIDEYLIQNPIDRTQSNCYVPTAQHFGVASEFIRDRYRFLRKKGKVAETALVDAVTAKVEKRLKTHSFKEKDNGDVADVEIITKKRVKTLEDLIEVCQIDTNVWDIASWEANKWEVGRKDRVVHWQAEGGVGTGTSHDSGKINVEPLFQVKAKLIRRKLDKDILLQKQAVLAELRAYSPIVKLDRNFDNTDRDFLLEICTFDVHLGSLSWSEESGENYDIKIAEARFKNSVNELLKKVNLSKVERILFPIGNDLMNIDNKNNATANGTVVDTDVRFMKMLKIAKRLMIDTIGQLACIAPVDVVVVPGNHDATVSLVLGEILDCFFHNDERITVYGSPKTRKYYQYGKTALQFTHGDEENHKDLGLIFATEQKQMWADTEFRFCQVGHFHKNKKISYVSVDEFQGFQVQIIPTLSSATAWAHRKGYHSLKQAKAFLFDKEGGCVGEFTTTAK